MIPVTSFAMPVNKNRYDRNRASTITDNKSDSGCRGKKNFFIWLQIPLL